MSVISKNDRRLKSLSSLRSAPRELLAHLPVLPGGITNHPPMIASHFATISAAESEAATILAQRAEEKRKEKVQKNAAVSQASRTFFSRVSVSTTLLGSGAFGAVYLGVHEDTGQMVAVKKVQVGGADATQVEQIAREIKVMRTLEHIHIVRYFHAERSGHELHILMEYMAGGSLASIMKKFQLLSNPLIKAYMRQVLLGIQYLHSKGVVHRDIKPDNVLLEPDGTAKISDFGTSRQIASVAENRLLTVAGTPWYMAPEVVKGTGHGIAADVWSLGCTMIELATGVVPFAEFSNPVTAMYNIAVNPSLALKCIPENASTDLQNLIRSCLEEDPFRRPSVSQMLQHKFFDEPQDG